MKQSIFTTCTKRGGGAVAVGRLKANILSGIHISILRPAVSPTLPGLGNLNEQRRRPVFWIFKVG